MFPKLSGETARGAEIYGEVEEYLLQDNAQSCSVVHIKTCASS